MKHLALFLSVATIFLLIFSACESGDDDDDDVTTDDDTADDDATDDDLVDDDLDDDAIDDDADDDVIDDDLDDDLDDDQSDDDTVDDDTYEDDACHRPFDCYSADRCARKLCQLYCLAEVPLIVDGVQIEQQDAVDFCRQGPSQLWVDIHDCAEGAAPFVKCLQNKGYPPEYPEIFDANNWAPALVRKREIVRYQALNLFYYQAWSDPNDTWSIWGGVVIPTVPLLRLGEVYIHLELFGNVGIAAAGPNVTFTPTQIDFRLEGERLDYIAPGSWGFGPYSGYLSFVPGE